MTPPISIDGTDITGATIDGTDVQEITVDGDVVFSAAPDIIDDFESGNLNAYNSTSGFQISNFAAKGNHSLELNDAPQRGFSGPQFGCYSSPGDGLANYFAKGQKMSYLWYADNQSGFHGVVFGVNSTGTDGFGIYVTGSSSRLQVRKFENNTDTQTYDSPAPASTNVINEWILIEVQWHDGSGSQPNNTIEVRAFNTDANRERTTLVNSLTATDSSYSNNEGIGFGDRLFNASTDIYIDHLVLLGPVD